METTPINFTTEEIEKGREITQKYVSLYEQTVNLQETITKATLALSNLANDMQEVKQEEIEFFGNLSHKYDLELNTVTTEFTNCLIAQDNNS